MYGFILIAYNNSDVGKISINELENDIKKRKIHFLKNNLNNLVFENIIGYQLFKNKEESQILDSKHLVAGDIYGFIDEYNEKLLNYTETIRLINKSNIQNEYIALEGNLCISSIFNDKIVFQNDLEGYRKIFYYYEHKLLCISTYLPLILTAIKKDWRLRRNAFIGFICGRESKWPLTFIEDIFTLSPLSKSEVSNSGLNISSKTFSDLYELKRISKALLRDKIYNQYKLIAERKVGKNIAVTLSGGYDSNCLTKLYSEIYKNNFTAVSVGYEARRERDDNIYNETLFAEKVAKKLKIPFRRYMFSQTDFFNEFDAFIDIIDQPGHDPSSNYIMNKYLKNDGFDLVVNGLGGDANFSKKRNIKLGLMLYYFSKTFFSEQVISMFGKVLNFRGPFNYFKNNFENDKLSTFHDLVERSQLFNSVISNYIDTKTKLEIDAERNLRKKYFENILNNLKTNQELFYSFSILTNPCEYHATLSAERNNIEILMPFVNTKAALLIMNGSKFYKINNRDFEMSIFGGIYKELLVKSKSGFSIPYSEWLFPLSKSIFEFYNDLNFFYMKDFDLGSFQTRYQIDQEFSRSNLANSILWKLLVFKAYIQKHNLLI